MAAKKRNRVPPEAQFNLVLTSDLKDRLAALSEKTMVPQARLVRGAIIFMLDHPEKVFTVKPFG